MKTKCKYYKIFSDPPSTNNNTRGAFVNSINDTRVFTSTNELKQLHLLQKQGFLELSLTFELENKLSFKEVRKETNEYGLL